MKYPLFIITMLLAACGPAPKGGSAAPRFTRVLALSAYLPEDAKKAALAQLEIEAAELSSSAPPGSTVLVFDATECRTIATLKAAKGAPHIRKKSLARPLSTARTFLEATRTGAELDGRVRLPHLAQALAPLRLPLGTSVVVLGNPLFLGSGSDAFPCRFCVR